MAPLRKWTWVKRNAWGVRWVLELVIVFVGLAGKMAKQGVYLAVGQPAFALFGCGVEVGEASADDERPDVVLVLG
jgi:hypothetical protein